MSDPMTDLSLSEGHTPGPWRKTVTDVDSDDATLLEGQSANIGDIDIAVSVDYADWDEAIRKEQAANQELLFAAPAMRSELVRLREDVRIAAESIELVLGNRATTMLIPYERMLQATLGRLRATLSQGSTEGL